MSLSKSLRIRLVCYCSGFSQSALLFSSRLSDPVFKYGVKRGKHFGRVLDAGICCSNIIDFGLEMWARQDRRKQEPDE